MKYHIFFDSTVKEHSNYLNLNYYDAVAIVFNKIIRFMKNDFYFENKNDFNLKINSLRCKNLDLFDFHGKIYESNTEENLKEHRFNLDDLYEYYKCVLKKII